MRNLIKALLLLASCLILSACSDETNSGTTEAKKDHVWKETTETTDRAKAVEGMILDSAANTQRTIDHQTE